MYDVFCRLISCKDLLESIRYDDAYMVSGDTPSLGKMTDWLHVHGSSTPRPIWTTLQIWDLYCDRWVGKPWNFQTTYFLSFTIVYLGSITISFEAVRCVICVRWMGMGGRAHLTLIVLQIRNADRKLFVWRILWLDKINQPLRYAWSVEIKLACGLHINSVFGVAIHMLATWTSRDLDNQSIEMPWNEPSKNIWN